MKAEGNWTYPEAKAVIADLYASGLVSQASISVGSIYIKPIDESAQTTELIAKLLDKHKGKIIEGLSELQKRVLMMARERAEARRNQSSS